jgi:hypothetical protein
MYPSAKPGKGPSPRSRTTPAAAKKTAPEAVSGRAFGSPVPATGVRRWRSATTISALQKQIADECGDNQALLSPLSDTPACSRPSRTPSSPRLPSGSVKPSISTTSGWKPTSASTFQTVLLQEFYSAVDYAPLATLACIKSLRVLISNNRYPLIERDANYMNDVSVNPDNTGQPTDYTFDANQMRLYPIPNGAYPMGLTGTQRFSTLSATPTPMPGRRMPST